MEDTNMKSFISYSWDNEEHVEWVHRFGTILRKNSIPALLDQFNVFAGSNLERFMIDGVSSSRFVICVISDGYLRKIANLNSGVGKEYALIQEYFDSEFVIPVFKNRTIEALLAGFEFKFWVDFDSENEELAFTKIVKRILGIDRILVPEISANPFLTTPAIARIVETEISKTTFIDTRFTSRVRFDYSKNDGIFTIGSGEFQFHLKWSKASRSSIHAYNDALSGGKIARLKKFKSIEEFEGIRTLDFTSRTHTPVIGDAIVWINKFGRVAVTRIDEVKDDTRNDKIDEVTFEYWVLQEYEDSTQS